MFSRERKIFCGRLLINAGKILAMRCHRIAFGRTDVPWSAHYKTSLVCHSQVAMPLGRGFVAFRLLRIRGGNLLMIRARARRLYLLFKAGRRGRWVARATAER